MNTTLKKPEALVDKPPDQVYVNKIQDRVILRIRSGHYLELFTPKTMKLPGSTDEKISKEKNGENVLQLKKNKLRWYYFTAISLIANFSIIRESAFVASNSFGQVLSIHQWFTFRLKYFSHSFHTFRHALLTKNLFP